MSIGTPGEARTVRSVAILCEELGSQEVAREWVTAFDYHVRFGGGMERANDLMRAAWRKGFLRRESAGALGLGMHRGRPICRYAYALPEFVSDGIEAGIKFEQARRDLDEAVKNAPANFDRMRDDLTAATETVSGVLTPAECDAYFTANPELAGKVAEHGQRLVERLRDEGKMCHHYQSEGD